MSGSIDVLNPDKPKRVVIIASNPAVSKQTRARLLIEALGV